jgi:hypothetical protein
MSEPYNILPNPVGYDQDQFAWYLPLPADARKDDFDSTQEPGQPDNAALVYVPSITP